MYDPANLTVNERFAGLENQLSCALGLERKLVAVTFHNTQKSFIASSAKVISSSMSYCSMVRLASLGHVRKASAVQVSCPGAQRALGLVAPDEEFLSGSRYLSLGLYRDLDRAKETSGKISIIRDKIFGFSIGPLCSWEEIPDVILAICNANQAMRLVQGFVYQSGPLPTMNSLGMQGVCAELTANPYCSQGINVSLLCSNTRYSCAWNDTELGVGISGHHFTSIVDGVVRTINKAEADKTKTQIVGRSKQKGMDLGVRFGCDYYSSPSKILPKPKEVPHRVAISLQNVKKSYRRKNSDTVPVLDGINFDIYSREFISLIGPSGCGKSTLLQLMANLTLPDSGTIRYHKKSSSDSEAIALGYVSQADTLLPWRTVLQNVELGLELRGSTKQNRQATAQELIEQVGLTGFEKCYPFELSGGMRKRVSVIRTLAYDPPVIFMDEPFVGLDVQTRDELEADIMKLWQENRKTIVMVTHDLGEAITLSDRVILLSARPARVRAEYKIGIPRPRSITKTKFTPDFSSLHKQIWQDLRREVAARG